MNNAYQVITDRIIELLEKGTIPWKKPWGGEAMSPKNLVSGKDYRGINAFLLSTALYESPYWLTFKQAKERGGSVLRGEHGYPCIYWNTLEREDEESREIMKIPFMRYYTVFNVQQCEDVAYPELKENKHDFSPLEACCKVINVMPSPPKITHAGHSALYHPPTDTIRMPNPESFERDVDYYATLFHELTHSTGHESRLARESLIKHGFFGSSTYSREELVAEMGATYLCGHTGIEATVMDNSAAYIQSWLKVLRGDNKLVITAASQAQKAADYILGRKPEAME